MDFLLIAAAGYLIGSFSPGYFFGRLIKGLDIREYGIKNTGATNTYRIVGPLYGFLAVVIDIAKAALVYILALSWLSPNLAIFIGLAAVLGHIAPFYLRFKGGKGMASLLGLCGAAFFFADAKYVLLLIIGSILYSLKITTVLIEARWRKLLKVAALVFPLSLLWLEQASVAIAIFILFALAAVFDGARFAFPRLNEKYLAKKGLAKDKELKRLSGYTLFLFGAWIVAAFFPKEIAILSLTFFILGDTFAPFSKTIVFLPQISALRGKTIDGALIYFVFAFAGGFFLRSLAELDIAFEIMAAGALLAATLDQLSFLLDDNLLVPVGTALGLAFLV